MTRHGLVRLQVAWEESEREAAEEDDDGEDERAEPPRSYPPRVVRRHGGGCAQTETTRVTIQRVDCCDVMKVLRRDCDGRRREIISFALHPFH